MNVLKSIIIKHQTFSPAIFEKPTSLQDSTVVRRSDETLHAQSLRGRVIINLIASPRGLELRGHWCEKRKVAVPH